MNRKRYQRLGAEEWQQHVRAQTQSGLSIAGYVRKQGLSESSFYTWRQRLQQERATPGFIRVDTETAKATTIIITTPNGYRVEASAADVGIATARALAQIC